MRRFIDYCLTNIWNCIGLFNIFYCFYLMTYTEKPSMLLVITLLVISIVCCFIHSKMANWFRKRWG